MVCLYGCKHSMKVAVLSQAYLVSEFRKGLHELGQTVDLLVVSPRQMRGRSRLENVLRHSAGPEESDDYTFIQLPSIKLLGAQYLLLSPTLGFKRFQPDVIQVESNPWTVVFWQAMLCRRLFAPRARVVAMVKKNTFRSYSGIRGRLKRWFATASVRRVDRFISTSEMTSRLYEREFKVNPGRLTISTHVGVDTDAFRPGPERREPTEPLVVGYCGRLAAEKGVTDLLEAVANCRLRDGLNVRLRLLGGGALQDQLASQALECTWLEVVAPIPNHDVPRFLALIDVFALPSRVLPDHEEHDAHALTEALAAGVAAIGTRSGIIPELLGDGTGLLVDPEHPLELAEGLRLLLTSDELRADLGVRGRAKALRRFALPEVARERIDLYKSILADEDCGMRARS